MLQNIIILLVILILISLASSLVFLFVDRGNPGKKRILYGLGFRVTLGAILLILVGYGLYTGQLGNNAPWG
ncbi:MAG: DUF2909 family protein [Proteobacteria bacterium]|uniref:DUF2909 domain-containing protein n=1 Tax=SAR86 cluster bacterium TaxID=2030880 RepID=A0A368BR54_9GAMM|nr:DUF2909 domain-containing protein [SAR86 cluster bacterium]MDA0344359.1 DUF2909 family protein [Pseudomonadota bacterium]OUW80116.1 MAG: twin transmembrane helix small protein [Gammaproteobacteria bacterium TMED219]MBL6819972.1 DUF2909 domain-containing protein [SAR86 cluster bacterium]MDA0899625.1 DUF2909 family protein [Pseudomonadota bacterium]